MKCKYIIILFFLFFGNISEAVFPDISKSMPNKVYPGQQTHILVFGSNSNFPEDIEVDLGDGITISSINSNFPWAFSTIKVGVVISDTASLGFRDITLTSLQEGETKVLTDAIEIVSKSSFPISFDSECIDVFRKVGYPSVLALSDFDNDNDLDLVVGGHFDITLYKNSGSGDFEYYNFLKSKWGSPSALGFGDFNGDKKIDIAVVSPGSAEEGKGDLSVFYGKGKGEFKKSPKHFETGLDPNSMAIGDLDRDGISDLVIANNGLTGVGHNRGKIQIFFGRKNRRLFTIKNRKAGKFPESVIIDDFNKDKNLDVVYSANRQDSIFVLLGNGKRKFRKKESSGFKTKGIGNSFLAQGFFDSNKKLDLAVTIFKYGPGGILTFLSGNGKGKFRSSFEEFKGSEIVLFEDLDNDEIDDLVTIDSGGSLLKGKGDGTFSNSVGFFAGITRRAVAGDLNGDGYLDFITANYDGGYISVLLNTTGQ